MDRPNIVLIMADQLAPHFLPNYGHRVVLAPNISRMADEGVTFDWAYTNSPLCGPSRYVMMTSCLPARIGAWDNAAEWSSEIPTFAHYLADRGYLTCLSGKMHFIGPDQLHGFEERLTTDMYPADYVWHPRWDQPDERQDWFHTMKVVTQAGTALSAINIDYDDEVTFRAERWIYDRARSSDRPFLLTVSFIQPHDPYLARPETWDMYDGQEIDMPITSYEDAPRDPHSDRLRWAIGASNIVLTEQQIRAARRAYYSSVSDFDRRVGLVRNALEKTGQADNTIIIVTSDHGDMLGERGLWFKMSFLERSVRVPLIFWCPDRLKPGRVSEAVSLVDLGPTLVGLATDRTDIDYPTQLDGRSLLPHLYGDKGHDEVIGEYYAEGALTPMFMVQRRGAKYVVAEGDPDQVFDVKDDPEELANLAKTDRSLAEVKKEIDDRWDRAQLTDQVLESQRRRAFVSRVMHTQGISWDFTPTIFRGPDLYVRSHMPIGEFEERSRFPPYTSQATDSSN